ncbi:hypothetical protein MQC88_00805 [Luteimonas sp. 50]|uniref:ABC transporter permease n=1 Tax=Cognatiluteimonas sedimenti TaxID=2927791 RepID=A0ABT0A0L2_9GAMM|nr:hypothetical protein [Lysobacter sedimenti]MCJ0824510.1 hypothetical protein [Lysobacter sedimenti]
MSLASAGLWRSVAAVLVADLRQRLRAPRTWVVIVGLGALMWWCFPATEAQYLTVSIDGMRGRYSSAWIGMIEALIYSSMLSLFGFFLVRGTLVRDFETRAWQLLVATTMRRGAYLFAKWLSHMLLFGLVVAAGMVVGLFLQWLRAEDRHIDLVELLKPTVLLTLPTLALTAAVAVWFDMVPWLRRSVGNVLFFVLWVTLLSVGTSQASRIADMPTPFPGDPHGVLLAEHDLGRDWPVPPTPGVERGLNVGVQVLKEGESAVLVDWTHWDIDAATLRARGFWLAWAFVLLALAVPLLDRCAAHVCKAGRAARAGARLRWLDFILRPLERGPSGALVAAELRLVLRQRRWWWWLALLVLLGMQAFAEPAVVAICILLAWVLLLDVFARLVLREQETGTGALVFTAPAARRRLAVARVLVSVGLAWALALPAVLRLASSQPTAAAAALAVGASFALWGMAVGALARNGRLFELLGLAVAYAGLQHGAISYVLATPATTLRWHLLALPVALVLLGVSHRRTPSIPT